MEKIRQARKSGNSVVITMSEFIEQDKWYKINRDNGIVTLKEVFFSETDEETKVYKPKIDNIEKIQDNIVLIPVKSEDVDIKG